ncbi:hypothetical protein ACSQ76_01125 [Roseovarius sp. B08]|uniref:hypothetical protein n=1 Tax=Roseovarius sp. B08 TaxID=3449223 RepID=UPI003EDC8C3C
MELKLLSDLLSSAALSSTSINDALAFLRLYARLNWENISGFFSNEPLEDAIYNEWRQSLCCSDHNSFPQADFLHIATQTHRQGGHTRLLWNLSEGLRDYGTQALLLTDARKRNFVDDFPGPVSRLEGPLAARSAGIVAASRNAKTVLLHIHPDDSPAALAARVLRAEGKRVLFVNHADHVFSLATGAADVVLEICMTGWKTTSGHRSFRAQSFMGIPIATDRKPQVPHVAPRDGPIVSMGNSWKYDPAQQLSFPDFLMRLLPKIQNDVVLIGPSEKDGYWKEVMDAFPGRIRLCGLLPTNEVDRILKSASCYIDSFPIEGGTSYPQAVMAGVPCFAPNANEASGITPVEELRFETVDELEHEVVKFLHGEPYPFDLNATQRRLRRDFSEAAVAARVLAAIQNNFVQPFDYLERTGRRDPDYNAKRWIEAVEVRLPKRIWRDLSPFARIRFLGMVRKSKLSKTSKNTVTRELVTRWI